LQGLTEAVDYQQMFAGLLPEEATCRLLEVIRDNSWFIKQFQIE